MLSKFLLNFLQAYQLSTVISDMLTEALTQGDALLQNPHQSAEAFPCVVLLLLKLIYLCIPVIATHSSILHVDSSHRSQSFAASADFEIFSDVYIIIEATSVDARSTGFLQSLKFNTVDCVEPTVQSFMRMHHTFVNKMQYQHHCALCPLGDCVPTTVHSMHG